MSFCSRAEGARVEKGRRMGCRSSAFVYSDVRCREQSCSRSTLECQALRVRQRDEQFALSFEGLPAVRGANVVHDQKIAGLPRFTHRGCRGDPVDRLHVRGSGNSAAIDVRLTTPRQDQVHRPGYAVGRHWRDAAHGPRSPFWRASASPAGRTLNRTSCTLLSSRKRLKLAARMRSSVVQPRCSTSTTSRGAIHTTLARSMRLSELASASGLPLSIMRPCHIALACSDVNPVPTRSK
jgi:hypothetical protein